MLPWCLRGLSLLFFIKVILPEKPSEIVRCLRFRAGVAIISREGILMITVTEDAKAKILLALKEQVPEKTALRLEATANGTSEFSYAMKLIGSSDKNPEDIVVDAKGLELVVDPNSAQNLKGATLDFEEGLVRSGFKFQNPNKPETPRLGEGPRPDLSGPLAEKVQRLLDTELNPAVAAHGGIIHLVGVKENKVYLSFGGGCHGCGMVDVTLKQGVETRIKELIAEVKEIIDTTDHSEGVDPYYAAG